MSSQVRLRLLPSARCLYDEPIQVKVSHLRSRQVVTIKASSTDEKGVLFSSSATYRADGNGDIDLVRDASLSGSYAGVEPMGLLRTLKPHTLNTLFMKEKALEPLMVKFSVHDEEEQDQILAEETNERLLMADGVSRVSVKEGSFRGVLFTPPGTGPFPAVLDLSTIMSERRAALLANKGFVVLTLPVFQEKLGNLKMLHLDPFEEAIIFLLQQPKVDGDGMYKEGERPAIPTPRPPPGQQLQPGPPNTRAVKRDHPTGNPAKHPDQGMWGRRRGPPHPRPGRHRNTESAGPSPARREVPPPQQEGQRGAPPPERLPTPEEQPTTTLQRRASLRPTLGTSQGPPRETHPHAPDNCPPPP
ncbi:acyl-coenzyme A thioesterase 3 isoform X2 [Oryzias melastigma]|uniref:acyl-coenzyme A thioesterase 3 isoform X2 n=1 Tax=Oryzias melastigma TaxID=30732 RepID=UPI00168D35F4|nr:acyl-coenzyme A thioesterase 3 isoform X2 [Oryzias melastigma]